MRPNTYRDQRLSFCQNCDHSVHQDGREELFCSFDQKTGIQAPHFRAAFYSPESE